MKTDQSARGADTRPLSLTVRGRSKNPPEGRDPDSTRKGQDPSLNASVCARAGSPWGQQARPAPVAALCRGCASAGRSAFVASVSFGLRWRCRARTVDLLRASS